MTHTSRTAITSYPSPLTESTTRTTTTHYFIRTNEEQEPDTRTTRSKDSHLGILIDGFGPASGRPQPTLRAVDLAATPFKIVTAGRWSPW